MSSANEYETVCRDPSEVSDGTGDSEEQEDMMERDLAEDAQWKRIQQNTFTRWANEHLKKASKAIVNLETDLSDGLLLIHLIEVLSGKQMPRYNKKPVFRSQKLENVSVALKFLERENIRIVNIDSTHIVDSKTKLILGLIWTLILHYSISIPMLETEGTPMNGAKPMTPKERLMNWIQNKLSDLPIRNFTKDWRDGKAVGALVDAVAPGLCPDWPDWNPQDAVKNASEAMGLADDWLDVRQLIKPEEMVNPDIDEQSMMTYLSQYPAAQLKNGAPLRRRANPNWVRAYGPGIEPTGNAVGVPANFTIETVNAGRAKVEVNVINPQGQLEPSTIKFNDDSNMTYQVSYKPRMEGTYTVDVIFGGKPIQKSPFKVGVKATKVAGDASKVTASGPGLNPTGNVTNHNTYFDIFTEGAGEGTPEVVILDPQGHRGTVPVRLSSKPNGIWRAEYSTPTAGLHSVNVFFDAKPIPNSPFGVQVAPVSDPKKVKVTGRGVEPEGIRVKDIAQFFIYTEGAGEGVPEATILGPGGSKVPVTLRKLDNHKYEATYHPDRVGPYVVIVTFAGQEVAGSPYKVKVSPFETSNKIRAFGPGLKGGIVNLPACCNVVRNGEAGELGFRIEGPSQAKIECIDNHDGSADVRYVVSAPGDYAVHILCDNDHIPGSPFLAEFVTNPDIHPDKVEVTGSGVQPTGLIAGSPTTFNVNTKYAGTAPLQVEILDKDLSPVPVSVADNRDGTYTCKYTPKEPSKYSVQVNYGGVAVKQSPFHVKVTNDVSPGNVILYGEGVGENICSGVPVTFTVDCSKAGQGDLSMGLVSSIGSNVELRAREETPGVYTVSYVAPHPGDYTLNVGYAGFSAPQCPKHLHVRPGISESDLKNIKVLGLEKAVPVNSLQQFRVLTQGARKAEFAVAITSPSGLKVKAHIVPTHEGYLVNFTPTELGEYLLGLTFGGEPLTLAPYRVTCTYGYDSGKVRATGPGLEKGTVGEPAHFLIDTRGAGQGGLGVTVEGPCEAAINCRDNGDGTCSVAYLPTEPGDYTINIAFNDQHIHGSPFQAVIAPFLDLNSINVSGDGIQPNGVYVDCPADIWVDSRGLGNGVEEKQVTCQITNPSGRTTDTIVTPFEDGTYQVTYTPFEEGDHKIEILYDGMPVPGSPFIVNVQRGRTKDSNETRAFGPGLVKGVVGKKNRFTILHDGVTKMKMEAQGPSTPRVSAKDNRNGTLDAEYEADVPGTYAFYLKTADEKNIEGSPFIVQVEEDDDVVLAGAYGPALEKRNCYKNVPFQFFVRGYEPGTVTAVSSTERGPTPRQPSVKNNGDGTHTVTVYPPPEGETLKVQAAFSGKPIPKGSYQWKIVDAESGKNVKIKGRGIECVSVPASVPVGFTVDTRKAGDGDVAVNVTGPDGKPVQVQIEDVDDGIYGVVYLPEEVGPYSIGVKYANNHVTPYSPATVHAVPSGCAARCKIEYGARNKVTRGEQYCITVNTQEAGHGTITCKITSTLGNDVDPDVVDNKDGTFSIYYSIKDTGEYTLKILFGGVPVPDGVYTIKVTSEDTNEPDTPNQTTKETTASSKSVSREHSSVSSIKFREVCFDKVPLPSTGGHASAEVKMPSGNIDKPIIEDNRDGTVSIRYGPKEEGLHELLIKYNGEHVQGSPYKFHVDSISSGYVTAYGSGLTHGVCGEPANFTITTKGAGTGGLTMAVEGPSKADISCHDNKDGTVSVSYLPTAPGEYKISVKFSDKHIKGSPYSAKITGEGRKRNQISVSSCSEVSLPGKVTDSDIRLFNASIQSPSGLEEPCYLKLLPNGNLCVSFTPRMPGEHQVSVKRMGKHIKNSPFKINVAEMEVGDARKVKVTGAIKEGKTHIENFLNVDTKSAGFGGLSLSIEGPSKTDIACRDNEDGTLQISYKPTEPGYYIVNLKFADHHVTGSPFTVKVSGEGSNRVREKIQRQREAVPVTEVGSQCKLTFKMPGITAFDLSATVTSPGGVTEDAEINEVEDGLYAVHFVPKELGVHTVCVKYKDIHIPGSPFQFTVGPLKDGGAHRVHAGGPGLERGEQGQPCEFNVWTREAGAGSLAISVEGPSKAQIDYKDRKDGSCYVSYVVTEPGEYRIGIKFNDQHIPDSPYKVYISPAMGDAHKLEVAQFPESGVKADQPSSFLVRKNGAKGELDGKIVSPAGVEDDCFIQSIDSDTYSVRFMPRDNGIHNIHLKFNGVHIPGSPYRIKVGKEDADPAAVHASGNGLKEIKTGIKTDFMIDTCNAGAGTLAVTIDGPSKVAMDCTEIEEGYKVRYTPLSPGDYYVSVKYNGYHIVGSPFKVSCIGDDLAESGAQETSSVVVETVHKVSKASQKGPVLPLFKSDASKVTSKGMGLKKAYLQKQNMFTVHCGDAGNNILFVGVHGPKGPCDEVFIKHMGRNNYQVNYVVRERGEYILIVRWGDEHIPGSPYKVDV